MKLIILHLTGLATEATEELEGRTLLEAADAPALDDMARRGTCGTARLLPEGVIGGPGIEFLCMMGALRQSRDLPSLGALEALGVGVKLYPRDVAFRTNMSSLDEDGVIAGTLGAGLPERDLMALMEQVDQRLSTRWRNFYPGRFFAHLMVWTDGPSDLHCVPAPVARGRSLEDVLPEGDGESPLREFIWDTVELLSDHRINHERREEGSLPVNLVWPWAPGRAAEYRSFALNTGLKASAHASRMAILGAAKAFGIPAAMSKGGIDGLTASVAAGGAENNVTYAHVDVADLFEHADEPETHVSAVTELDSRLISPVLDTVKASAEAARLVVVGGWADVAWEERPDAPWVAFPSLRGTPAATDLFSEAAAMAEGQALDEPDRLLQEGLAESS